VGACQWPTVNICVFAAAPAARTGRALTAGGGCRTIHAMDIWADLQAGLDELAAAELLRRPVALDSPCGPAVTIAGRRVVCLCSNDYLGLADDPAVKSAAVEAIKRWGVGAGASRLISGTMTPHVELERRLSEFKGAQAAIVTSTGWMANHAAICTLVGAGDLILCDKLNHASVIDAARASGARLRTYPHRDVGRLRSLLQRHRALAGRCLIVTDSLFSMDGDLAPLAEIAELKKQFDALLLIDEAHATGVLGADGRGAAELMGVEADVDVTVGTLSKALGALGGFIAAPKVLIDTLANRARPYIYTTAPPPCVCAAAAEALGIVQSQPHRRQKLLALAGRLRSRLRDAGVDTGDSDSQIIPIILGSPGKALRLGRKLLEAGFLVPAIRPPTVPRGASRLRVSLSAAHEQADIDRFAEAVEQLS